MIKYKTRIIEQLQNGSKNKSVLIRTMSRDVAPELPPVIPEPTCSPKSTRLLQYVDYDTSVIPETTPIDKGFALYMSVNGGPFETYYGSDFLDIPEMFARKTPSNMPLPRFDNNDGIELIGYGADGVGVNAYGQNSSYSTDPTADNGVVKRFNIVIKPIPDGSEVVDLFISFDGHEAGQVEIETCLGYFPNGINRPVPPYYAPIAAPPLTDDGSFKTYQSYVMNGESLGDDPDIKWIFHYNDSVQSSYVTYAATESGAAMMGTGFPGIGYFLESDMTTRLDVGHVCSHYSLVRVSDPSIDNDEFADYLMLIGLPVTEDMQVTYDLFTNYVKSKYNFAKEVLSTGEMQIAIFALDETSANLLIDYLVMIYTEVVPGAGAFTVRSNWTVEQKRVLYKLVNIPSMVDPGVDNGFDFIKPLMKPINTPLHLKSNWVINYIGQK